MSKQILNQRYCYRLNSNFIERNKGNVKTPNINTSIKQRYIVGIGDSTGTRMIRKIINSKYDEDYINNLKKELKKKRKEYSKKNTKELKKKINKLMDDIKIASLQDYICNVEFKKDKHYDKYSQEGFILNNHKYDLLLGTPGGIKKCIVMFVRSDVLEELEKRLNNDANFEYEELDKETGELKQAKVLPSKIMGYKALTFSSSTPVKWTNRVLVVKDVEKIIHKDVIEVKYGENGQEPYTNLVKNKEIKLNVCDGCGLIRPSLAEIWAKNYLKENYVPTSFCIRNAWTKGIVTKFDYESYCLNELHTEYVTDVWGQVHNIKDINLILNESMLKLNNPFYKNINDYLKSCLNNGYEFAVTKYSPKILDNERTLNYQYVQCLDLNDEDIDNLLENNIREIKEVLGINPIKSILFGKGKDLNDENVWFSKDENDLHIKALMINKNCIQDDYITTKIKRAISKKIDQLKTAKIKVKGNYQISIGEPIIQLQSMCGIKEPNGLLKDGEFYIKYWKDKGIKKVGGFRSPMSCKENARIMNVCNRDEVNKYYDDLYGVIVFNSLDTSMMAFNGQDHDGDINFTTSNPIILKGIKELPALDCDSVSSDKIFNPQKEDFIQAIKHSFGNKVGSVTNVGSSFYDKQALFDKSSEEYKELDKRIQIIQLIQQSCIDSAKQGKPPESIPGYWFDNKCEKVKINKEKQKDGKYVILDDEETVKNKNKLLSMCAYKKPYYFQYIYNDSKNEYNKYKNEINTMCLREFKMTLEELKNKDDKSEYELNKLNYYLERNPLSDNNCLVNIIAHKIENVFDKTINDDKKNTNFDYSIYINNSNHYENINSNNLNKLKNIYKEYKFSLKNKNNIQNSDKEESMNESVQELMILKDELLKIYSDEMELADILVYLSYKRNVFSKTFVWTMVGETILKNMLEKNNNKITYPYKNNNGNIIFDGDIFGEKELTIEIKEDK